LEILLGAKPEAPVDETSRADAARAADHARLTAAGTDLLKSAFSFLSEVAGGPHAVEDLRAELDAKLDKDDKGKARLSFALPAREKLESLARGLLNLIVRAGERRDLTALPRS